MLIIGLLRISPLDIFRMGGALAQLRQRPSLFVRYLLIEILIWCVCFFRKNLNFVVTRVPDGSL